MNEYVKWVEINKDTKLHSKYYKGLGTSTDQESSEYFDNFRNKLMQYKMVDPVDKE